MVQTLAELDRLIDFMLQQDEVSKLRPDIIMRRRSFDTWADAISRGETTQHDRPHAKGPLGRGLRITKGRPSHQD